MSTRWVDLDGAANVRDLGGLPAPNGQTISGMVLRSDALDALSPADVDHLLQRWHLRHVVDLRSDGERLERGRGLLNEHPIRYSELQIIDEAQLEQRRTEREQRLANGESVAQLVAEGYAQLIDWGSTAFVAAFRAITAPDGGPALIHCSAGKDRTGILAALLLGAAGVHHHAIVADYALTTERMDRVIARLASAERFAYLAENVQSFVFAAHAETMEWFLQHLDDGWGGPAGWLRAHGVTVDELTDWRTRFVG
ncbi:MAG: tyrosine-protein phosphatase [Acidimicrobiales bacterium]